MALLRVVLLIDCDNENILEQVGQDYLDQFQDSPEDNPLAGYVENELGWIERSFNSIKVQSIDQIEE